MRRLALVVLLGFVGSLPSQTCAQAPVPASDPPHRVGLWMGDHPGYTAGYMAAGLGLFLVGRYGFTPSPQARAPLGGPARRVYRAGADRAADIVVYASMPATLVGSYLLDASGPAGLRKALRTPVVLIEAWGMTNALAALLKNLGVCRPYSFHETTGACGAHAVPDDFAEQRRGFPSSHTANAAVLAGALWGLWLLPSQRNQRLSGPALSATVIAGIVSGLRVRAGAHSPADVTAGFVLGAGVGVATAALHRTAGPPLRVSLGRDGLVLSGRF